MTRMDQMPPVHLHDLLVDAVSFMIDHYLDLELELTRLELYKTAFLPLITAHRL